MEEEDSATRKIDSRGVRRFRVCRGGRSEFFSPLSGDRDERSRSGAAGEVGGDVAVPWWWRGLWMEGERWSFFFFFSFSFSFWCLTVVGSSLLTGGQSVMMELKNTTSYCTARSVYNII